MPSRASTSPSIPSRRGTENPQMSASSTPTTKPRRASATARFTVSDDLPTPPLPEATASTRVLAETAVSGASWLAFQRARLMTSARPAASICPIRTSTGPAPGIPATRFRTSRSS